MGCLGRMGEFADSHGDNYEAGPSTTLSTEPPSRTKGRGFNRIRFANAPRRLVRGSCGGRSEPLSGKALSSRIGYSSIDTILVASYASLRSHTLACLAACQQSAAGAADAVQLSTRRPAAYREKSRQERLATRLPEACNCTDARTHLRRSRRVGRVNGDGGREEAM